MYKRIENEFEKKSCFRKIGRCGLAITAFVVICYMIGSILVFNFSNNKILWQIILAVIIFLLITILFYFFVFCTLCYLKKDKKKKFFHFMDNINEFRQHIHEKDLDLFIIILKENQINNNQKLEEVINHYRIKISRNVKKGNDVLAFVSLIISLIALFSTDYFASSSINVAYAICLIIISLLLYWLITSTISKMSLILGEEALYERIESILAEIYMEELFDN